MGLEFIEFMWTHFSGAPRLIIDSEVARPRYEEEDEEEEEGLFKANAVN